MNVWTSAVHLAVRFAEGTTGGADGGTGGADGATTEFNPDKVSPGIEGFLMTGLLALAVIGLGFLLVRTLRANSYREEVREQIAAELAEQAEAAGSGAEVSGAEVSGGAVSGGAVSGGAAPEAEAKGIGEAGSDPGRAADGGAGGAAGGAGGSAQK